MEQLFYLPLLQPGSNITLISAYHHNQWEIINYVCHTACMVLTLISAYHYNQWEIRRGGWKYVISS